jgi:hypothetical protein
MVENYKMTRILPIVSKMYFFENFEKFCIFMIFENMLKTG